MNNHPIYIIGKGNLGWHLNELFKSRNLEIAGWLSSRNNCDEYDIPDYSLVFVAVSDQVIEQKLQELLKINDRLYIVYCSGSIDIVSKYPENVICWYPLYSFTKGIQVDWMKIPVFMEAFSDTLIGIFLEINKHLNIQALEISAETRKKLHLSAVFINNFTTACVIAANSVINSKDLFPFLLPILNQTFEKITLIEDNNLNVLQTGPARRGDEQVINSHIQLLKTLVPEQQLYEAISKYIKQKII